MIMSFVVRRLRDGEESVVSSLVRRTLLEVNSLDYPVDEILRVADSYSPEKIQNLAESSHFYIALFDDEIVGCGAIGIKTGLDRCCVLTTVFVLPEHQGKGIGKAIMEELESDARRWSAARIELQASITAVDFYRKAGYSHLAGQAKLNENGLYKMEKVLLL